MCSEHFEICLPSGAVPLQHQVAGHRHGKGKSKKGFLQTDDGFVLKPVQYPPKGIREMEFYQQLFDSTVRDPVLLQLRPLIPKYLGTFTTDKVPNVIYLKLEDLADRFLEPCIMDIKVGPVTYDPYASAVKIASEKEKFPAKSTVGFQLMGMRVYHCKTNTYECHDKMYGRSLNEVTVFTEGLPKFYNEMENLRKDVIQIHLQKLKAIEKWFLSQKAFHFYASSLLLLYDGKQHSVGVTDDFYSNNDAHIDNPPIVDDDALINSQHKLGEQIHIADVRMIDFTHVFPASQRDDNYLFGLQKLIGALELMLDPGCCAESESLVCFTEN